RQLAVALLPAAGRLDPRQALEEPAGADLQLVDRDRVAAEVVPPPQLDRIDAELLGRLVALALDGEARLHAAVAALGPAGGLVGVGAPAIEAVGREAVRRAQQLAGVVGGDQPEAGVGAAVDDRPRVHRGDRAVAAEAGPVAHLHRVAA